MYRKLNKYFVIFGNVRFVAGSQRALLIDTYRKKYFLVPLSFMYLFRNNKNKTIKSIYALKFSEEERVILDEYFRFMEMNDIIFFTSDKMDIAKFISISEEWDYYGVAANAVMEIPSIHLFKKLYHRQIMILDQMGCLYLQMFFGCKVKIKELTALITAFDNTEFRSIEIHFEFCPEWLNYSFQEILLQQPRISLLYIYNSPLERELDYLEKQSSVHFTCQPYPEKRHCGIVRESMFAANSMHYTESLKYNTCLNRKISIDINGEIKNCPSMAKSYGNIRDTKLIDVANDPEFQKVWYINKDQVKVCRDCEFRYLCTDCRAYLEDPDDLYSKPLKCGYNPYTCEWEEWSTNPLKQMAIDHYGMRDILPKNKQPESGE